MKHGRIGIVVAMFLAVQSMVFAEPAKEAISPPVLKKILDAVSVFRTSPRDLEVLVTESSRDVLVAASRCDATASDVLTSAVAARGPAFLRKLFKDHFGKDKSIRLSTWQSILGKIGGDRIQVLREFAESENAEARLVAARCVDGSKDGMPESWEVTKKLLADKSVPVAIAAVKTVEHLQPDRGTLIGVLEPMLDDPKAVIRFAVADTLSKLRHRTEVFPAILVRCAQQKELSLDQRLLAVTYLGRYATVEDEYVRVLLGLWKAEPASEVGVAAIRVLQNSGVRSSVLTDAMQAIVGDGESPLLPLAIDILGRDATALAVNEQRFAKLLSHDHIDVRLAALTALAGHSSLTESTLLAVASMSATPQSARLRQVRAGILIKNSNHIVAQKALEEILTSSSDPHLQTLVVRAIEEQRLSKSVGPVSAPSTNPSISPSLE